MYAKVKDEQVIQYPYSFPALRREFPDTSFPEEMPVARLAEWGVVPVQSGTPPAASPGFTAVEVNPVLTDGVWCQAWEVRPCSEEETAAKAAQMRSQRTRLLAESDWTQLADSPVDREAWGVYRQALREVPKQAEFPWAVKWPTPPA